MAILQQIPMSIEEAAISLGATKMKAFFRPVSFYHLSLSATGALQTQLLPPIHLVKQQQRRHRQQGHLSSYATAFGKLGKSIQNTIIIPILALVVIILLAILIAYLVVRRRNFLTNITDLIIVTQLKIAPDTIPACIIGTVMRKNAFIFVAPREMAASSMLIGIC